MKRALCIAGAVVAFGLLVYLLSPLVIDRTVDEPLRGLTLEDRLLMEKLQSMTPKQVQAMTPTKREETLRAMEDLSTRLPDITLQESQAMDIAQMTTGSFRDADGFHKGSGTATIYREGDGAYFLRFENFSVTNGPALYVELVRDPSGDLSRGAVELGKLKGNKGNQNYEIPEDVDISQFKSAVIWCKTFDVTFSIATFEH